MHSIQPSVTERDEFSGSQENYSWKCREVQTINKAVDNGYLSWVHYDMDNDAYQYILDALVTGYSGKG